MELIKLAGLDAFFTIKIGWNQVNDFPYDSFWWQGIDGTRVLTHFSTTPSPPWGSEAPDLHNCATYNAKLDAFAALGSWGKLKHKEAQRTMLMSYGYGNGGGGPTREMNENSRELRAFPALPRVRQGTVREFFQRLEVESGAALPTWNGELYLETHRGTYTTQGHTKRANRKGEFLLHDAELLATWAALIDPSYSYPTDTLRKAWRLVCLNQFHDIIPGSSIGAVYAESDPQGTRLPGRRQPGWPPETARCLPARQGRCAHLRAGHGGPGGAQTAPGGIQRAHLRSRGERAAPSGDLPVSAR